MRPAFLNETEKRWEQYVPVKDWYGVAEVSVLLFMNGAQVYQTINRGTLQGHKVNGTVMVSHENLLAYMQRRSITPTFDPDKLHIEAIVPADKAKESAAKMVEGGELDDELDFDFDDE